MAIVVFSLAGLVAGVTLVVITKNGWAAANNFVITTFIVMSAAAVFFGAFPSVFQQEESIADKQSAIYELSRS